MQITEITVMVGETREHPFQYGNRRAEVSLTATVTDEDSDLSDLVTTLRCEARHHVERELGQCEGQLHEQRRVDDETTGSEYVRKDDMPF